MSDLNAAQAVVARVINAEGGQPGNSLHSWRCEHPDRYGPCDCVSETAEEVVAQIVADPEATRALAGHLAEAAPDLLLAALTEAGALSRTTVNAHNGTWRSLSTPLVRVTPDEVLDLLRERLTEAGS